MDAELAMSEPAGECKGDRVSGGRVSATAKSNAPRRAVGCGAKPCNIKRITVLVRG